LTLLAIVPLNELSQEFALSKYISMKFPEPSFQIVPDRNFALFVALFVEAQNALFTVIAQVDRFRSSRRGVQGGLSARLFPAT